MVDWIVNLKDTGDFEHTATIRSNRVAVAQDVENKDLLNIKFILCHEGSNFNKDGFYPEELERSYKTIVNKPINWEHTRENIGVITNAHYLDPSDLDNYLPLVKQLGVASLVSGETKKFILCEGVIWKDRHAERAIEMLNSYSSGKLFFSMENWFDEAECSECKARFKDLPYCSHLTERHKNGRATRYFRNFIFTGAGKVNKPGDPGARGISFAKLVDTGEFLETLDKNDLFLNTKTRDEFINYVDNQRYNAEACDTNSIDDMPSDDIEKVLWLFICKEKNSDLFNQAIASLTGDNMKTYTEEDFQKAVTEAVDKEVANRLKDNQKEDKIKEYEDKVKAIETAKADLDSKLAKAAEEMTKLSETVKEKETAIANMEEAKRKDQEFATRISLLQKDEIPFDSEKVKPLIYGVDETVFNSVKESLAFAAQYKKDTKGDENMTPEEKKKKEEDLKKKGKANQEESQEEHDKINKAEAGEKDNVDFESALRTIMNLSAPSR